MAVADIEVVDRHTELGDTVAAVGIVVVVAAAVVLDIVDKELAVEYYAYCCCVVG